MNGKQFESINVTITCNKEAYKYKQTLGGYDNKGKEKTSSMSENKENSCDGYVIMYSCGKKYFIQHLNAHAQHNIRTPVRQKKLLRYRATR